MLDRVRNKLMSVVRLDHNQILKQILDSTELQEEIIYLNTIDQLYKKGEDKLGRSLDAVGGGYSPYTIQIKSQKGQPTDRVTLKDTGAFYESWKIVNDYNQLQIIANPLKGGKDINREWGGYVIGLQPENLQKIIDEIKIKYIAIVKRKYMEA